MYGKERHEFSLLDEKLFKVHQRKLGIIRNTPKINMPPKSNFDDGDLGDCTSSTRTQYNPLSRGNQAGNECGITHKGQMVVSSFRRRDKTSTFDAIAVNQSNQSRNTSIDIVGDDNNDIEQASLLQPLVDVSLDEDCDELNDQCDGGKTSLIESSDGGSMSCAKSDLPSNSALKLVFGAFGIYSSYLVYGHVQEDLFLYKSPINGENFTYAWLLQSLESFVIVSLGSVALFLSKTTEINTMPKRHFFQSGISQVMAKTFTSLALSAGLSFPVCTLAKSAKIVPVMIGQIILGKTTKYALRDYAFALLLVSGTALLSLNTGNNAGNSSSKSVSSIAGLLWIMASLCMDGVTAGLQKRIQNDTTHGSPGTLDFLLLTNLSMGAVAFAVAVLLPTHSSSTVSVTNELLAGIQFLHDNREALRMVSILCCCSFIGQSFIFFVISQFDPLVCSTITTTRKILSVLWSILMKGHSISLQGQFGIMLAVGGLLLEVSDKTWKQSNNNPKKLLSTTASNTITGTNTFSHVQGSSQLNKQSNYIMVPSGSSLLSSFKPKAYTK